MATVEVKPKKTITAQHGKFAKLTGGTEKSIVVSTDKTKSKKSDKKAKAKATEKNIATAAKKASSNTIERESKYSYSEDCKTAKDKKEFRRKARATDKRYEKELKTLKKATDAKGVKQYDLLRKEFSKWRKETYAIKEAPVVAETK